MKKLMIVALVFCAEVTAQAKPFSSNKPYNQMTEEEKAVRRQEAMRNRLEHFGGDMIKPGSQKGRILFVNGQSAVKEDEIKAVIASVTRQFKYNVACVADSGEKVTPANATQKLKALGADIAIFVTECDACDNMVLVAPDAGWAIVNASAVVKDATNDAFRNGRMRKQLTRAFYAASGAMNSKYPGSLMGVVRKPEDLDRLGESAPVDVIQRSRDALEAYGVTPEIKTFYRRACEQGWAPAPTNAIQQAIWDEIHALPAKPIRIKPETKKVAE